MSDGTDILKSFFAFIFMAVGFLVMLLSGLCSAGVLLASIPGGLLGGDPTGIVWVAVIGGIPFGVGWLFWMAGKALVPKEKFAPRHSINDPPPPSGEPSSSPPSDPPSMPPPKPPRVE